MNDLGVTLHCPKYRQAAALGRLATQTRVSGWDLNPRSLIQDNSWSWALPRLGSRQGNTQTEESKQDNRKCLGLD